jgi:hypothetical protein
VVLLDTTVLSNFAHIAEARVERDDQMGRVWSGGEQQRQED